MLDGIWHAVVARGMELICMIAEPKNPTLNWGVQEPTVDFFIRAFTTNGEVKPALMSGARDYPATADKVGPAYKLQVNPDTLKITLNEIRS